MSGSGGYYKYRCKYWLTYNCPNWVWVNNAPCAHCLVRLSSFTLSPDYLLYRRTVEMINPRRRRKPEVLQVPRCLMLVGKATGFHNQL